MSDVSVFVTEHSLLGKSDWNATQHCTVIKYIHVGKNENKHSLSFYNARFWEISYKFDQIHPLEVCTRY